MIEKANGAHSGIAKNAKQARETAVTAWSPPATS